MDRELRLLDVVALVGDLPNQQLRQGQVGTICMVTELAGLATAGNEVSG